jgi:hypothetical protein
MDYTAEQILNMKTVGELFTNDKSLIKTEYINLCKQWHPDVNTSKEANDVMVKITLLYTKALDLINENKWEGLNFIKLSCTNNKAYELKYLIQHDFELGTLYIGNNTVTYLIKEQYKDFYDNYKYITSHFKYANDKMRTEFEKYVPKILESFKTNDGQYGLIISKSSDLLLLKDVLNYFDNKISDRHVAWILSTLYNLTCFINYNNLSQNGITLDNYYISPTFHSGVLIGGWWYSVPLNNKMLGMSKEIYNIIPPKTKEFKTGNITTDLESIRLIGRKLLGNDFKFNPDIPKAFIEWLMIGSSNTALEEYQKWNKTLTNAYGKRTFVKLSLSAEMLYNKK